MPYDLLCGDFTKSYLISFEPWKNSKLLQLPMWDSVSVYGMWYHFKCAGKNKAMTNYKKSARFKRCRLFSKSRDYFPQNTFRPSKFCGKFFGWQNRIFFPLFLQNNFCIPAFRDHQKSLRWITEPRVRSILEGVLKRPIYQNIQNWMPFLNLER